MTEAVIRPARFVQPKSLDVCFKVMTGQEAEAYMVHLAKTNGVELTGVEKQVEKTLQEVARQRKEVVSQISNIRLQLSELEKNDDQLLGQMNALGFILQKAEDERRWERNLTEVNEEKEE